MTSLFEKARELADADYIGKPPYDNFERLTLGEQQGYRVAACRTAGAVYETLVSPAEISIRVKLPPALAMKGMSAEHAAGHERFLHKRMEDAVVWVLEWQSQEAARRSGQ